MIPWALLGTPPPTVGFQGLLAFWTGGAGKVAPPSVGFQSLLAPWMGGAAGGHGRHLGNLGWNSRHRKKPLKPVERIQRIADEMRALYRDVYEKVQNNEPAAEEAAALVAKYAPVNAPDVPPPNVIDWEMLADEGRTVIVAFREALIQIQLMLAEQDDEEALLMILANT